MTDNAPGSETPRFEDALAALDDVLARLESGDVGLEQAITLFEEGQSHLAACRRRLEESSARIDELTKAGDAAEGAEPF